MPYGRPTEPTRPLRHRERHWSRAAHSVPRAAMATAAGPFGKGYVTERRAGTWQSRADRLPNILHIRHRSGLQRPGGSGPPVTRYWHRHLIQVVPHLPAGAKSHPHGCAKPPRHYRSPIAGRAGSALTKSLLHTQTRQFGCGVTHSRLLLLGVLAAAHPAYRTRAMPASR